MNHSDRVDYRCSPDNRELNVLIYASEYRRIQAWVNRFQSLETGGDLFGLWSDQHTAVAQLVLGPGEGCRRTGVSFYQDVNYLERVGNHLTGNEGLCHIGEWHSHHTLGLTRPSGGDKNTVWSNMWSYGIHRFVLFIANIEYSYFDRQYENDVKVSSFLFEFDRKTEKEYGVKRGRFQLLSDESPFRSKLSIQKELVNSAESEEDPDSYEKCKGKSEGNRRHEDNYRETLDSHIGSSSKEESKSQTTFSPEKASQPRQRDSEETRTTECEKENNASVGMTYTGTSNDTAQAAPINTDDTEENVSNSAVTACSNQNVEGESGAQVTMGKHLAKGFEQQ